MPPLVGIGLTELPNSGGAKVPPAPLLTTALKVRLTKDFRAVGAGVLPPVFDISVFLISTRVLGGRLCSPHYHLPPSPRIFKLSYGPVSDHKKWTSGDLISFFRCASVDPICDSFILFCKKKPKMNASATFLFYFLYNLKLV